jgi:hypothetical protein
MISLSLAATGLRRESGEVALVANNGRERLRGRSSPLVNRKTKGIQKDRLMMNLKAKASETAEHMVNVVTETVEKVGHAASEALHKGEHALSDMARKAVGLAPEATDKLKEVGNKVAGKTQNGVATGGLKVEDAADKIKGASAKTKNDAN